ncbi:SGNH/GDSL hydrolase family protein [Dysgonomonas sp. Marseille-P4361]|uniref:SGNH/GDSL hydrolase family protein n=1 Tax=Dysgonomonas sp. Marseille-P4361 TaxID=2161820 RepID=UPI000D55ED63|nr:SGNH/GDSL hydrolase family protein [Dysgonomonas sp. Marseille-P4361]
MAKIKIIKGSELPIVEDINKSTFLAYENKTIGLKSGRIDFSKMSPLFGITQTIDDSTTTAPASKVIKTTLKTLKLSDNPFVPEIQGSAAMPVEQWRNFILGLELNIEYNPNLFYSPAIVVKTSNYIAVNIYSSENRWTNQNAKTVATFQVAGVGVVGLTNDYGSIVINTNFAPASSLESQWAAYAGLSSKVFNADNSENIRLFKAQNQLSETNKQLATKSPISDREYNPFDKSIQDSTSMTVEQWRKFILGLELNIAYNPNLFYSFTIVNVSDSSLNIYIWSSKNRWTSDEAVSVATFNVPKNGVQYIENAYGIICVDTNFAPDANVQSQWFVYSGLSASVFNKDNNENIRLYKRTKEITSNVYDAFLPPKMYAVVGKEFNLYYDTFILCPEYGNGQPPFMFDTECVKGAMDKRSFRFTPTTADVGEFDFSLRMLDKSGNVVKTLTSKLVVVDAVCPDIEKTIICIGDSTSDDTADVTKQLQLNLAECSGVTPLFLGSHHPAPYKNEARTGKTYSFFANGDTAYRFNFEGVDPNLDTSNIYKFRGYYFDNVNNAIMLIHRWKINADGTGYAIGYHWNAFTPPTTFPAILKPTSSSNPTLTVTSVDKINYSVLKDNEGTGVLNFGYYRTEALGLTSDKKIDILTMDCGINDLSGVLFTSSQINTVVNNAKKIIDAFITDNPNGKVVFCLPKSRNSDLRSTSRNMLRYNIFNFSKKAVETFANYEGVIISQSGFAMDRFYGYPLIEQKVASRYEETLLMANNDVHPRTEGYYQIADGMTGAVLVALK